ncbi:mannose-6-phosphate isomerase [Zobellia amurskyensis]|uniref:Phosphohexomutase n=1 Tax=Zobellia amurskyensis TaxID=248905 RepID=A0A7X3D1H4_9FLAO|nr:type I phosphomannose isomerase catalytic subunit [Zobellia amurskyensis]MUH35451.1 mannose-6-phosphate isomerase [Zobellia amurskyensis]
MISDLQKYAQIPLKQISNRVWRTYSGGALIDNWKKESPEVDNSFPEEWIMSTVTARGKNRPEDEGLSKVETTDGLIPLKKLIDSNKELFLGKEVAQKFGSTGVLIKMLDSQERLTIQVHPDKIYAKDILNSSFGKTESWYVLNTREIEGEKSVVYMGFKKGVTREKWEELFVNQDIEGMLNSLHRIEVKPGDAFMIYGGVPHAIGSGCFLMEVQEPTDYTMRVEKVTPAGLEISQELIHQGVGEQKMLDCFHYDNYTLEEAMEKWKVKPKTLDSSDNHTHNTIFNKTHTDCFGLSELYLDGEYSIPSNGGFYVVVAYQGEGKLQCNGEEYPYKQGDEIFISAAIENVTFKSTVSSKLLLCYPPS